MDVLPTVDWILLALLVVSLLVGAWRGLVFELISLVSWLAAFILAQWFAPSVASALLISSQNETLRYGLGFALVFIATVFAGGLVAFVIKKLMAAVGLTPADRLLGALFGLLRGGVIVLVLAVLVGMTPLKTEIWWQEAQGVQWASGALHSLKPMLPEDFGKYIP